MCRTSVGSGEKFSAGKALDVGYMEEVVSRLVEASMAPLTRKTYLSGQMRYFSVCKGV